MLCRVRWSAIAPAPGWAAGGSSSSRKLAGSRTRAWATTPADMCRRATVVTIPAALARSESRTRASRANRATYSSR